MQMRGAGSQGDPLCKTCIKTGLPVVPGLIWASRISSAAQKLLGNAGLLLGSYQNKWVLVMAWAHFH